MGNTFVQTLRFFLFVMLFVYCASPQSRSPEKQREKLVKATLGSEFTAEYNRSRTFVLYKQKQDPAHIGESLKYLVLKDDSNEVVQEGYVKWVDDTTIEVLNLPGKLESPDDVEKYKKQVIIDGSSPKRRH
jgi:hypothetical protein